MKKFLVLMSVFLLIFGSIGCVEMPYVNPDLSEHLESPHKLWKMFNEQKHQEDSSSSWGGFFFFGLGLAGGSGQSNSETVKTVTFAWEDEKGIYIFSEIPLSNVRVEIVEQNIDPNVRFVLNRNAKEEIPDTFNKRAYEITKDVFNENQEKFWNKYLSYALITCNAEDCPEDINLPLNR